MNIAQIGYGKMGKAIEAVGLKKGHNFVLKIDLDNAADFTPENLSKADVAIEFTGPHSAADNILRCIDAGIPVVSGSTGWLHRWEEIKDYCLAKGGTLLYASNFSIGVNLFFELNKYLAKLMEPYAGYNIKMEEIHHTQKKDAPSGTAITLAEQILQNNNRKQAWVNQPESAPDQLPIISKRIDPAPGTHTVNYTSEIDDITIVHTAHNRVGFAGGAVLAAEFIHNKKGIYTMKDVLGL